VTSCSRVAAEKPTDAPAVAVTRIDALPGATAVITAVFPGPAVTVATALFVLSYAMDAAGAPAGCWTVVASWPVRPVSSDSAPGFTLSDEIASGAADTLIATDAVRVADAKPVPEPVAVTVIVATPVDEPAVTRPCEFTEAIAALEVVYATTTFTPDAAGRAFGTNASVWPDVSDAEGGDTVSSPSAAGSEFTVTAAEADWPADVVAVIVVLPEATAVTVQLLPETVAVATPVAPEAHDASVGVGSPPEICTESVAAAPGFSVTACGVMLMTTGADGATGTVTSSPQAAKTPTAARPNASDAFLREKKCIRPPSCEVV
jgi:hypothetical protein